MLPPFPHTSSPCYFLDLTEQIIFTEHLSHCHFKGCTCIFNWSTANHSEVGVTQLPFIEVYLHEDFTFT